MTVRSSRIHAASETGDEGDKCYKKLDESSYYKRRLPIPMPIHIHQGPRPPESGHYEPCHDCWFLTGPTAAGKTAVGIALARRIGAEIVSLDSMAL